MSLWPLAALSYWAVSGSRGTPPQSHLEWETDKLGSQSLLIDYHPEGAGTEEGKVFHVRPVIYGLILCEEEMKRKWEGMSGA